MLLAYFESKPSYPRLPAGLADDVAMLCLVATGLLGLWAWTRSESLRRGLAGLCDPRVFAVLRIGFALMTLVNFINLEPYWRMLWTDEGLFMQEYARDRLGRSALRGWTPEDGFLDLWAVACFLWNKPSLLYINSSPSFLYGYLTVFFLVLILYGAGIFSRVTGVLAWFLMSGIYNRNALYWEGTDTVYRCFWLILLFARTGHAWSVDNWWRCRRLRKQGRLHEGEGPPPEGKEPIYRLVPAWTRYVFMVQLSVLYTTTGLVKTGGIWKNGDALYFALNMDHFYRFELVTQYVSYWLGTTVFRAATWVTWWWEKAFPVVLLGMILKFGLDHRDAPWRRTWDEVAWRRWLGRALLVAAYVTIYRIVWTIYPWTVQTPGGEPGTYDAALQVIHVLFLAVGPALVALWYALGRWSIVVVREPRKLWRIPVPRIVIDQGFLRRWFLGRRLWLGLGLSFHGTLILFMNIGMFPFIMLMTYAAFVDGEEWARFVALIFRGLRRMGLGRLVPRNHATLTGPAEPAAAVEHRGGRLPELLVLGFVLALGAFLVLRTQNPRPGWLGDAAWWWVGILAAVSVAMRFRPRHGRDAPALTGPGPAAGKTALARSIALVAFFWHSTAITMHLFPAFPVLGEYRSLMRFHSGWLRGTGTTQSWNMFAPNPPTANSFMVTIVVEEDGDRWDLRNNSWEYRPNPWIINDRMRKMQRRMIGKGKWYLRYWAEFQCREWILRTGSKPLRIDVEKIVTRIPGPQLVREKGPFDPRRLRPRYTDVKDHLCKSPESELPVYMKERYGLEVTEEDREREALRAEKEATKWESRARSWLRRRDWGGGPDAPPRPGESGG